MNIHRGAAAACLILAAAGTRADEPPVLERVGTIALRGPVGGLDHMAFDAARGHLFVANTSNGTLDIVDVGGMRLLEQIPGQGRIRGVDYIAERDQVVVGNGDGGVCNVFDAKSFRLVRSIPLGINVDNVRFQPKLGKIYAVHEDRELSVIDASTFEIGRPIPLVKSLGALKTEMSRPRLYVNAKAEGVVVAIDAETGLESGRFPVAPATTPASLAVDEAGRRLFVGCRGGPSLVVLDSDTGQVVARVPIPGGVDDLWYDGPRGLVIASCGDGAVALIGRAGQDRYEPIVEIPTAKGARTSYYDADAGRLYLGVPRRAERQGQADPEIWVYAIRP